MRKMSRKVMIILISTSILLGFCSCRLKESYKKFFIKNITDNLNDDYFNSEQLSFARLQNVVIIPEVRAINHGEYIIYISVYSKSGNERVRINNVIIKEKESIMLNRAINKDITFTENANTSYEGWIDGGTFSADTIKIEDDKEYNLIIEVEVKNNGAQFSEKIAYEIVVKGYRSLVWQS